MEKTTRRQFLGTAAVAGAAIMAAPWVRTAHSAGKLSMALWNHWVPGANDVMKQVVDDWAKKNSVDVKVDFIAGTQLPTIGAGEARARTGHDIFNMRGWMPSIYRDRLEPLDDVQKAVTAAAGPFIPDVVEYVCKHDGRWVTMPSPTGSHTYPMVSRIDYFKKFAGVDVPKIFPASPHRDPELVKTWTWANFEKYAQKLHAAGHAFGAPISNQTDSGNWIAPIFRSYGSQLVDAQGNITVDSDATREVLTFMKQLTQWMPPEVYAWDNAGNNRWLISGKGGAIVNPPSAWAVAKRTREKDVAAFVWHNDTPIGPKGHFRAYFAFTYGVWNFSKNKSAAKDLIQHLLSKEPSFTLISASQGYDLPGLLSYNSHPIWPKVGPPEGGQYNYPVRTDEILVLDGSPAPPPIAASIQNQAIFSVMTAKATQEKTPINEVIKWAERELEGFMRG